MYKDVVGTTLESLDIDMFNTGVDSLKAFQMRRNIQKTLHLNGISGPPPLLLSPPYGYPAFE